jgi:deazaflavin-dependent oxidoreductase (nitroreductase family)
MSDVTDDDGAAEVAKCSARAQAGSLYTAVVDLVRLELADDPTVDITTTGRQTGLPRRIEIWMLDVDGRFFITGTPGRRDWLANLLAHPSFVVHLKRHAHVDLPARATPLEDAAARRTVLEHLNASWYRTQEPLGVLLDSAPLVEVTFDQDS